MMVGAWIPNTVKASTKALDRLSLERLQRKMHSILFKPLLF